MEIKPEKSPYCMIPTTGYNFLEKATVLRVKISWFPGVGRWKE